MLTWGMPTWGVPTWGIARNGPTGRDRQRHAAIATLRIWRKSMMPQNDAARMAGAVIESRIGGANDAPVTLPVTEPQYEFAIGRLVESIACRPMARE